MKHYSRYNHTTVRQSWNI